MRWDYMSISREGSGVGGGGWKIQISKIYKVKLPRYAPPPDKIQYHSDPTPWENLWIRALDNIINLCQSDISSR